MHPTAAPRPVLGARLSASTPAAEIRRKPPINAWSVRSSPTHGKRRSSLIQAGCRRPEGGDREHAAGAGGGHDGNDCESFERHRPACGHDGDDVQLPARRTGALVLQGRRFLRENRRFVGQAMPAAERTIAFRIQRTRRRSRSVPTIQWRVARATRWSAGPNAATRSVRSPTPAAAPVSAGSHPQMVPTASTMVSASTNSTIDTSNVAVIAVPAWARIIVACSLGTAVRTAALHTRGGAVAVPHARAPRPCVSRGRR